MGSIDHKIPLNKIQLVGEPFFDRILLGSADLIGVDVQAGDVASRKLDDFSGRSANAATNIQHSHARLDADAAGQKVFVPVHSLPECLSVGKSAEVECLAPAVFVEVGRQVVVSVSVNGVS